MAKINDLPLLSNPTEDMYCLVGKEDVQKVPWSAIMGQIGAPYIATTVAGMTDKTRVYVYQGSESGYTSGNWYYWNGSAWTSGGIYNSAAVNTDKTLTQSDKPADSAVVGKEIGSLKEDLGNLDSDLYSISSNILDTNGLLENTAIKDWGNPTIDNYTYESAGKYSTRPIPVLADEIYKSIGYEFCYILFNSDGSFTTGNSLLNSTVGTIKIPNGIGYIVFMFSHYSNIPTGIMRVESEQETPVYKPYGEKEKKYATVGDIEEVKEQIDNVTTTEPSKNVLLDGVLLENTDLKTWETVTINNYNYASTGKYSTSLIDCKSGDVFYPVFSNGKGSPSMGYTIFDANGNMIDHD